jgi:hypothetical protein
MLAIAAGLGALQPGVRRLRALAARGSEASVWMSPASAPDDLRAQVAATTTFGLQLSCMRRTVGFPLFLLQDLPPWSGTVSIQGLRPYAETAATIEPDVLRPLGAIRSELRTAVWPVALRTGAASHAPWEGVLGLALAPGVDGARSAGEPVFFYRWGAPRPGRGREAWTDGPVQVLGTSQPDPWGPRTQPRPPVELAEASALATEPRATVVHAVGTPVVTSYGPRLRLAEGYSPAESNEPSSMTKVGYGRGSLGFLDPSMLPKDLPLLVLQQQPADSQARVASDREQAALLRAVAADLFEGGCDAVIVVPSLPPELAALVMRRIADGLSVGLPGWRAAVSRWVWRRRDLDRHRGQRALRELAAIVRSARDLVFEWDGFEAAAERIAHGNAETPPELPARERWADRELAWDFCLYARPGVSGSGDAHAEGPLE